MSHKRNIKGLTPFDSKRAKEAASKPRLAEKTVKKQFSIFASQHEWLAEHCDNDSALIRELLEKHIKSTR